jgi:hypothetical protein
MNFPSAPRLSKAVDRCAPEPGEDLFRVSRGRLGDGCTTDQNSPVRRFPAAKALSFTHPVIKAAAKSP